MSQTSKLIKSGYRHTEASPIELQFEFFKSHGTRETMRLALARPRIGRRRGIEKPEVIWISSDEEDGDVGFCCGCEFLHAIHN